MLNFWQHSDVTCEGVSRRSFLQVGALGGLGLALPQLLAARKLQAAPSPSTVTNCILIWTRGGTSHHDTFDPKPQAPASVKGEFGVIDTAIPGVKFTDIVPNMARELGRYALLRGWNPKNGSHGSADQWVMSGRRFNPAVAYPTYGSVVSYYHGFKSAMPPFVQLGDQVDNRFGGGTAGVLGLEHNPFAMLADPNAKNFSVRDITPPKGISMDRVDRRRKMLSVIDDLQRETDLQPAAFEALDEHYKAALNMITAPETKKAFEIDSEDPKLRDRYGRHRFGQSCLLARRLIQAGVRFVTVTDGGWDTHQNNFKSLKSSRIPPVDQALPQLVDRPGTARHAGEHAGSVADRLRTHAEDQLRQRPGPLGECRVCDHGRRGHPRRRGVGRDRRRRRPADSQRILQRRHRRHGLQEAGHPDRPRGPIPRRPPRPPHRRPPDPRMDVSPALPEIPMTKSQ